MRLSTELFLKVQSQLNRVATIKAIANTLPATHKETSMADIELWLSQVDKHYKAFLKEHSYFKVSWPAAFINHEYFARNTHQEEAQLVMTTKLALARLKHALTGALNPGNITQNSTSRFQSRLPDISLPKFDGEYSKWPAFRELFGSLILDNARLTNIEKLHYLRSCTEGSPALVIGSLPLTGDSLQASWELLISRYENKRLTIQAHLDQLFNITTPTAKHAASLTKMISTVAEENKALQSLGVSQDMWDCILVHHVSRHLDRVTRKAWETSLGVSQEYPRFQRLESFVTSRARALERIEATQPTPTSKPVKKSATAHQSSTQQTAASSSSPYPCDCCSSSHFIVVCSKFRELSIADRRRLAVNKRLRFNCLGRHNARSCKSTRDANVLWTASYNAT